MYNLFCMSRLFFVLGLLVLILFIFWNRNKKYGNTKKTNLYKNLLVILIIGGILFILATSGRFILPQLMQIIKIGLPFITKLIGI